MSTSQAAETFSVTRIGEISVDRGRFELCIDPSWRPALAGIAEFGHIVVTWWADQADQLESHGEHIVEDTPYVEGPSNVGVLATRSPLRPSRLGLSVSAITDVDYETGRIGLGWIDALDKTPVVDVKPYYPSSDRVRDVRMPAWCADWPVCLEDSADFDWEAVLREG